MRLRYRQLIRKRDSHVLAILYKEKQTLEHMVRTGTIYGKSKTLDHIRTFFFLWNQINWIFCMLRGNSLRWHVNSTAWAEWWMSKFSWIINNSNGKSNMGNVLTSHPMAWKLPLHELTYFVWDCGMSSMWSHKPTRQLMLIVCVKTCINTVYASCIYVICIHIMFIYCSQIFYHYIMFVL